MWLFEFGFFFRLLVAKQQKLAMLFVMYDSNKVTPKVGAAAIILTVDS